MIQPAILSGSFDEGNVGRVFNDTQQRSVAAWISTEIAKRGFCQIAALLARMDAEFELSQRGCETRALVGRLFNQMVCEAKRGFTTNSW